MTEDEWVSHRKRRMPSMRAIAVFHGIESLPAHCWRCGWEPRASTWATPWDLQRAHVVDRSRGGLDIEPNFRPLCVPCHRDQPSFGPGEEALAIAWFASGDLAMASPLIQMYSREAPRPVQLADASA